MNRTKNILIWAGLALLILLSVAVYFFLPDRIPMSWGWDGEVTQYWGKSGIFLVPGLAILTVVGMRLLPLIDPKKKNYPSFQKAYLNISVFLLSFLIAIQIIIIHNSFIPQSIRVDLLVPVLAGFLITFIGNLFPQLRNNFFLGIRTPWTLSDETVWKKTHRIGGRLWFFGGILMALSVFLPMPVNYIVFFSILAVICIIPVVYSFLAYRRQSKG